MMTKSSRNDIWVYCDLRNQRLLSLSFNVLAAARRISEAVSGKTVAVILGAPEGHKNPEILEDVSCVSVNKAAETCRSNGADQVYILENPELATPRADIHSQALIKLIQKRSPKAVFFGLTDFGREMAAYCARRNNGGLIADCTDLQVEDEQIVAGCPSWGGEILARLTYSDPSVTGFATIQPHAFQAVETDGESVSVEKIILENIERPENLKQITFRSEPVDHRRLEDAPIVVVGGAGMGSTDGFGLVRKLAAAIGGEVGATRPPVLYHWADEERLIGQTGKTVRPELLFSIGTSGAVQYTAGIMDSSMVIAINRDSEAPIFQTADVGIVADAKVFLPLFTDRIKQLVMRNLADALGEGTAEGKETGFGAKINKIREAQGWTLEDLAQNTGQAPEYIQQVENDEITPSVSFLLRLSRALKVDPGTFLKEEEKAAIQDQRAQAFIKRTKNYFYETLTPGAENEHLRGFMITIEPRQAHKPVAYKHEGEEFIYLMEGSLELTLGNKKKNLKAGESTHFNSEIPHKLKNLGSETTRCLVVLYTP